MFSEPIDSYKNLPCISIEQLIFLRIYQALKSCEWNRTKTAILCGVSLRMIRYRVKMLKEHGYVIGE